MSAVMENSPDTENGPVLPAVRRLYRSCARTAKSTAPAPRRRPAKVCDRTSAPLKTSNQGTAKAPRTPSTEQEKQKKSRELPKYQPPGALAVPFESASKPLATTSRPRRLPTASIPYRFGSASQPDAATAPDAAPVQAGRRWPAKSVLSPR